MFTAEQVDQFKSLVATNDLDALFRELAPLLSKISPMLENDLRLQENNFRRLEAEKHGETISHADYELEFNKLLKALLYFLDQLPLRGELGKKRNANSEGKILHNIPRRLPIQQATKCTVRIAETEELVKEGFTLTEDTQVEDTRLSDWMEVELLDMSGNAFDITSFNSQEQTIDPGDVTQWIFFVKPLIGGQHTLYLKVSIIKVLNGKERKKEIVFEKEVSVESEVIKEDRNWQDTSIRLNTYDERESIDDDASTGQPAPPDFGREEDQMTPLSPDMDSDGYLDDVQSTPPSPRITRPSGGRPPSPRIPQPGKERPRIPKKPAGRPQRPTTSPVPQGNTPKRRSIPWSRAASLLIIVSAAFLAMIYLGRGNGEIINTNPGDKENPNPLPPPEPKPVDSTQLDVIPMDSIQVDSI